MIQCENLVKIYKTGEIEVVALQGLDLTVEDGGVWPLAAPQPWRAYLRAPRRFAQDLAAARWKTAFLRRALRLPLPYGRVYAALKTRKGG